MEIFSSLQVPVLIFPLFIIPSMKYLVRRAQKGFTCEISYFVSMISWLVYFNSLQRRSRFTKRRLLFAWVAFYRCLHGEKLNDVFILTTVFTFKRRRKDGKSERKNMKMTGRISLETSRKFIVSPRWQQTAAKSHF